MALYLTEADVNELLTMPEAVAAVEAAFAAWGRGEASNTPRTRFFLPRGVMHQMAASYPARSVMGTKTYTTFGGDTRFWVQLFSSESGDLLAYIEADKLGQMRTGAATGVAAKWMARPDARQATLFGSGWQAESQAEALLVARPELRGFHVHSRDAGRRDAFCQRMTARTGVHFESCASPEAAARGTEIIVCATGAREPILRGEWLSPGDFVAGVGANRLTAREMDEETISRAAVIAVDDVKQAQSEAAELIFAHEQRRFAWERAHPLAEIVSGRAPGRTGPDEITVFKSLGIALEDIAVAAVVYEKAQAQGVGRSLIPDGAAA